MKASELSLLILVAAAILPGCSIYPIYSPEGVANNASVEFHAKLRPPLLLALEEIHICSNQKKFRLPLELNVDFKDNSATSSGATKVTANKRITIQHPFNTTVGVGYQMTYSCRTSFTFVPKESSAYQVEAGFDTVNGCWVVVAEKLENTYKKLVSEVDLEGPCK